MAASANPSATAATDVEGGREVYSVWALPEDDVAARIRRLMDGLRSEFGGPQFKPHVTVVGATRLALGEALEMFKATCEGFKAYTATVERVATGTFFYQCVYLLLRKTPEVMEAGAHGWKHFNYSGSPYMPHLSLLYGDLSDEEKKKAEERAYALDDSLDGLSFQITRFALYKTDTDDKSLKSWEKVAEFKLGGSDE